MRQSELLGLASGSSQAQDHERLRRLAAAAPRATSRTHVIALDSDVGSNEPPRLEVQFKGLGTWEAIRARR